jgi:hypothetical protein
LSAILSLKNPARLEKTKAKLPKKFGLICRGESLKISQTCQFSTIRSANILKSATLRVTRIRLFILAISGNLSVGKERRQDSLALSAACH